MEELWSEHVSCSNSSTYDETTFGIWNLRLSRTNAWYFNVWKEFYKKWTFEILQSMRKHLEVSKIIVFWVSNRLVWIQIEWGKMELFKANLPLEYEVVSNAKPILQVFLSSLTFQIHDYYFCGYLVPRSR